MREINAAAITDAIEKLCVKAAVHIPPDLAILLECAEETEITEAGTAAMHDIVENFKIASEKNLPICQDTG
ncbi:MAG: fumarate hydratase, partial [Oscillospiraceae bacterium]|nr:fumarate hydratase [Oscillospiraceae bacterium]